jgi:hypothetical protein
MFVRTLVLTILGRWFGIDNDSEKYRVTDQENLAMFDLDHALEFILRL